MAGAGAIDHGIRVALTILVVIKTKEFRTSINKTNSMGDSGSPCQRP